MKQKEIEKYIPNQRNAKIENKIHEVLGKKILSKNGTVIGRVKEIMCNADRIEGIIYKNKGAKIFMEYTYIQDFYGDSVILKINPAIRLMKMIVYDADGAKLGKVVKVTRTTTTNILKEIEIKKNIFKKPIVIPAGEIEVDVKNVILNKSYS